jgi:hypothetical protein
MQIRFLHTHFQSAAIVEDKEGEGKRKRQMGMVRGDMNEENRSKKDGNFVLRKVKIKTTCLSDPGNHMRSYHLEWLDEWVDGEV